MKKLILGMLISFLITSTLYSQSLSLSDSNGPIPNNDTITFQGDVNSTIIAKASVTNNSASTITVRVKKEYISIIPGSSNTFCWGNCFGSSVFISPITIPINAGAIDSLNFSGDYFPNGNAGISIIKYYFYDDNDTTDVVAVNVKFDATTVGIEDLISDTYFSEAYPNPATNQVTFDYSFPEGVNKADVIIRDILGNSVKQIRITDQEGKIRINTEDLTSGLYFYSVIVNDNIALSKKLIINR